MVDVTQISKILKDQKLPAKDLEKKLDIEAIDSNVAIFLDGKKIFNCNEVPFNEVIIYRSLSPLPGVIFPKLYARIDGKTRDLGYCTSILPETLAYIKNNKSEIILIKFHKKIYTQKIQ
ncbi:MAG: hypothetical protein QXQ79_00230 [Candidatus Nanoarchaeia archaeon]